MSAARADTDEPVVHADRVKAEMKELDAPQKRSAQSHQAAMISAT